MLVFGCLFALASCSTEHEPTPEEISASEAEESRAYSLRADDPLCGEWKATHCIYDGKEYNHEDFMNSRQGADYKLTFNADGTFVFNKPEVELNYLWEIRDGQYVFYTRGFDSVSIEDGAPVYKDKLNVIYFEKVEKNG